MFRNKDSHRTNRMLHFSLGLMLIASLFISFAYPVAADAPAPDKSVEAFETLYMKRMITNHALAVQKAAVCTANAVEEELRELCANISANHSQELNSLRSMYASWYGTSYDPQFSPGDLKQIDMLSQVEGSRFDIKFMKDTIRGHRLSILKSLMCAEEVYHQDLQDHCQASVSSAAAEIHQMQTWLCDWYEVCKPEPPTFTSPEEVIETNQ